MNGHKKQWMKAVALAVGVAAFGVASAEEVVLRAVSAFAPKTTFSRSFEAFVEKVNKEGKGLVQIRYLGGPEAMPPFQLGSAVSKGVVDMANLPGAFYLTELPAADALRLSEITIQEQRKNGAWEYINELHNKKMNTWYLARTSDGLKYHLYLTKKIDKPDLKGLTLRISPTYLSFFQELGANLLQTPPGEVYTALERGVVQGYGWPLQGVLDLGWQEVTKYRVDPGFYQVDVNALVNLNTWNKLTQEQRDFLTKMAEWVEGTQLENARLNEEEKKKQAEAGIETIQFTGEQAAEWEATAKRTGWDQLAKQAPADEVQRLRELLTKN